MTKESDNNMPKEKKIKTAADVLNEQQEKKQKTTNALLNSLLEDDAEYDSRLAELRKTDVVMTSKSKLQIPENIKKKYSGHKFHWGSTDPKASPSIEELKSRGYRVVADSPLVETGHHSTIGSGFHVLMAIPDDLANKRAEALAKKARGDYERVFKKQETRESGNDSKTFQFQENKIEGTRIIPYKPE